MEKKGSAIALLQGGMKALLQVHVYTSFKSMYGFEVLQVGACSWAVIKVLSAGRWAVTDVYSKILGLVREDWPRAGRHDCSRGLSYVASACRDAVCRHLP
jgi:hypothetical protein